VAGEDRATRRRPPAKLSCRDSLSVAVRQARTGLVQKPAMIGRLARQLLRLDVPGLAVASPWSDDLSRVRRQTHPPRWPAMSSCDRARSHRGSTAVESIHNAEVAIRTSCDTVCRGCHPTTPWDWRSRHANPLHRPSFAFHGAETPSLLHIASQPDCKPE